MQDEDELFEQSEAGHIAWRARQIEELLVGDA